MNSMRDAAVLLVLGVLALSVRVGDRAEEAQPATPDRPETIQASRDFDLLPEPAAVPASAPTVMPAAAAFAELPVEPSVAFLAERVSEIMAEVRIDDEQVFVLSSGEGRCGESRSLLKLDVGDGRVLVLEVHRSERTQQPKLVAGAFFDKA